MERYEIVMDRYRSGCYPAKHEPMDNLLNANGNLMEDLAHLQLQREELHRNLRDRYAGKLPVLKDKIQSHIHKHF